MKHIPTALALFVLLSAHKCNEKTAAATGGGTPVQTAQKIGSIVDSKWVLQTLKGKAVTVPAGATAPWMKLTKDGEKMEGFGGCNTMFGGFTLDGDRVKFPNLGSTKKFCEAEQPTENSFMTALRSADHFKLEGRTLKLLTGTSELATFLPE